MTKHPLRILIAEDSEFNSVILEAFFHNEDVVLDFATNGEAAVRKVMESEYDVVLMDIQMPLMNGLDATRTIRRWEAGRDRPRIPIIATTAYSLSGDARRSLEAGCDAHVAKPLEKKELFEVIGRWTGGLGNSGSSGESGGRDEGALHRIVVDPDLRELVPRFLESVVAVCEQAEESTRRAEFDAARIIGHRLKGEGAAYGFPEISAIGKRLQEAAEAGDAVGVATASGELKEYVRRVEVV